MKWAPWLRAARTKHIQNTEHTQHRAYTIQSSAHRAHTKHTAHTKHRAYTTQGVYDTEQHVLPRCSGGGHTEHSVWLQPGTTQRCPGREIAGHSATLAGARVPGVRAHQLTTLSRPAMRLAVAGASGGRPEDPAASTGVGHPSWSLRVLAFASVCVCVCAKTD